MRNMARGNTSSDETSRYDSRNATRHVERKAAVTANENEKFYALSHQAMDGWMDG